MTSQVYGELIGSDRQLSVIVVVCRMTSTLSNDISEATGPFKPKFHLWHPWAGG